MCCARGSQREKGRRSSARRGAHLRGGARPASGAPNVTPDCGVSSEKSPSPQAGPRLADGVTVRSAKKLWDALFPFFGTGSPAGTASFGRDGRSPCSINQRASMADEFSSIHSSSSAPISLRRFAAWLRRESSKLCSEVREAERRNSHGGSVL